VAGDLGELRSRIDRIDRALVGLLAERMDACREVADIKAATDAPIIAPDRVRQVLSDRRQAGIDAGLDPDFVEQVFRAVLAESHRIEVAKGRADEPPQKIAGALAGALETAAVRIDHVVVLVDDIQPAAGFLASLGFATRDGGDGVAAAEAGGATIVLVDPRAGTEAAAALRRHGSGVRYVAVEVLNAAFIGAALGDARRVADVTVDDHGHEQVLSVADPGTGLSIAFISRVGHRVPIDAAAIRALLGAASL